MKRKMRFVLLIVVAIMTSLLVNAKGMAMELSGTLVISSNKGIETLDLRTLERRLVISTPPWGYVLTKIDDNHLLMSSDDGIDELDIGKSTVNKIREGYFPQYVPEHRKLFFIDRSLSEKDTLGFFVADIDELSNALEIELPPKRNYGFFQSQVIQVSRDEVVFQYDERIWVYHIALRSIKELPIESCPILGVFRSATSQLLCGNNLKGGKTKFLVGLNGGSIEEVPGLTAHIPLLYIPEFDVLITVKKRLKWYPIFKLSETADLWVYNFEDGSETLLEKDVWAGEGSTVWIE